MRKQIGLWRCVAGLALAATLSGGCTSYHDYDAFMKRPRPIVGGKPYVIEPPDGIVILAPGFPEIHNNSSTIRPDGKITLPLLGDLFVAGKTPAQVGNEIEVLSTKYYEDVSVQVQVTGFASKVYYMAGETSMGSKQYTGKDTVLSAALGAGIGRTSWPSQTVVLRPNEEGQLIRRMSVDLTDMYEKGDLKYNAVLEEGDIVYIPINPVAAVGVFIQNLLAPISPIIQAGNTPASFAGWPAKL